MHTIDMYVITIKEKRGHEFERVGESRYIERVWRRKLCNYNLKK